MFKKPVLSIFILALILTIAFLGFRRLNPGKNPRYVYVADCAIYTEDFKLLLRYPAMICSFMKNGNTVIAYRGEDNKIGVYDPYLRPIWEKKIFTHHLARLSHDEKVIYTFSHDIIEINGKKIRFDKILAIRASDGTILSSWSIQQIKDILEKHIPNLVLYKSDLYPVFFKLGKMDGEFSHFNSIHEIATDVPGYSKGTLVVNANNGAILFFTMDLILKNIYYIKDRFTFNIHDLQITRNGDFLFYENNCIPEDSKKTPSSLKIFSPAKNKLIWKFEGSSSVKSFCKDQYGSIQFLENGNFLFSDATNGGHFAEVDKIGRQIKEFFHKDIDPQTKLPHKFFSVKKIKVEDLSPHIQAIYNDSRVEEN